MITVMLSNKKINSIVTELFFRGRNSNIPLVFITQSYFAGSKIKLCVYTKLNTLFCYGNSKHERGSTNSI